MQPRKPLIYKGKTQKLQRCNEKSFLYFIYIIIFFFIIYYSCNSCSKNKNLI